MKEWLQITWNNYDIIKVKFINLDYVNVNYFKNLITYNDS